MTPFDTALRIQRREVDAMRISISVEVERVTQLETQGRALEAQSREEIMAAAALPFPTDAWAERMKREQIRINEAACLAQARLGQLRAQAVEAYGTMRAIESAAERHRDEAESAVAAAEQAGIDDIAAAGFMRARQLLRKRPA
jgi:hypothetical protein